MQVKFVCVFNINAHASGMSACVYLISTLHMFALENTSATPMSLARMGNRTSYQYDFTGFYSLIVKKKREETKAVKIPELTKTAHWLCQQYKNIWL